MILYRLDFGPVQEADRHDAEDVLHNYLASLCHNGQACGDYFLGVHNGIFSAHVNMSGIRADSPKHHSKWGIEALRKVISHFGAPPQWVCLDDDKPSRDTTWANAPSLYLFTHLFDWESPLCRGDNGRPIPLYRIPIPDTDRASISAWQGAYRDYDSIWIGCGPLEIHVYKQMALSDSELSIEGRAICKVIEKATSIPTYYFMSRYWGRRQGEDKRRCPGCGGTWRSEYPVDQEGRFWQFPFRCEKCRLVSHAADCSDDERHAGIGEWKPRRGSRKSRD